MKGSWLKGGPEHLWITADMDIALVHGTAAFGT